MSNQMPKHQKPSAPQPEKTPVLQDTSLIPAMANPPAFDPVEAAKMGMPAPLVQNDATLHPSHLLPKQPAEKPPLGKHVKVESPKTKVYRVLEDKRCSIGGATNLMRKGKLIDEAHYSKSDIERLREQGVKMELVEGAKTA